MTRGTSRAVVPLSQASALVPTQLDRWMDAIAAADFDFFRGMDDNAITREAGLSAHESKTWLVGRAAVPDAQLATALRHYQAIPEFIAGFGILLLAD